MSEKYLVTSHGFATDPDSGGLFSSTAKYLLANRTMKNFNHYKKYQPGNAGDIFVPSLDEQTENLYDFVNGLDGEVMLMAHSRGTTAAARVALEACNVRNVILMAPPHEAGADKIVQMIRERGGGESENGDLILNRSNGKSKIYISRDYFPTMEAFDHMGTYQRLANKHQTIFVTGGHDKIINEKTIQTVQNAIHISVDAGHNLYNKTHDIREQLARVLGILLRER